MCPVHRIMIVVCKDDSARFVLADNFIPRRDNSVTLGFVKL